MLFQRLGPIDRTPGIPGSDKNCSTDVTALKTRYRTEEILLIPVILIRIVIIILTVFLVVTRVIVIFEQPVVIKTFIIVVWILISGRGQSPAQPRVCPALVSFPRQVALGGHCPGLRIVATSYLRNFVALGLQALWGLPHHRIFATSWHLVSGILDTLPASPQHRNFATSAVMIF